MEKYAMPESDNARFASFKKGSRPLATVLYDAQRQIAFIPTIGAADVGDVSIPNRRPRPDRTD